jgi:hypothetical protein
MCGYGTTFERVDHLAAMSAARLFGNETARLPARVLACLKGSTSTTF